MKIHMYHILIFLKQPPHQFQRLGQREISEEKKNPRTFPRKQIHIIYYQKIHTTIKKTTQIFPQRQQLSAPYPSLLRSFAPFVWALSHLDA